MSTLPGVVSAQVTTPAVVAVPSAPRVVPQRVATPSTLRAGSLAVRVSTQHPLCGVLPAPPVTLGAAEFTARLPIYVGPEAGAPATVDLPTLMILREAGAPACDTAIVVREP